NFKDFANSLPANGIRVWQRLYGAVLQEIAHAATLTCVSFVADADRGKLYVAAIIFIPASEERVERLQCAAKAFARVVGLAGTAVPDDSIANLTQGFGHLRPLDRDALTVLYGRSNESNRSLEQAIDDY